MHDISRPMFDPGCLCGNYGYHEMSGFHYNSPDKYELWMQIEPVTRQWVKCSECGLKRAIRDYDVRHLSDIYTDGYRNENFRGVSIRQAFDSVAYSMSSESAERAGWVADILWKEPRLRVMDIGSGIGVFPFCLKRSLENRHCRQVLIECVEPNHRSIEFLRELGFICRSGFYKPTLCVRKYDLVTMVHLIEHIESPYALLDQIKGDLKPGGRIFIEVPDSKEFGYLDKDHDEFNSCHIWFFDIPTLYDCVESSGYEVTDIHTVRTTPRNLSRIMMMARLKDG